MADLAMAASTICARLSTGDIKSATVAEIKTLLGASAEVDTGTFSRDLSLATGNIGYTGVGFQPIGLIFMYAKSGANFESGVGFSDGTNDYSTMYYGGSGAINANAIYWNDTFGGLLVYTGDVNSLDSDGFTIAWTKLTGSPTGTLDCRYIAIGDWA